MFDIPPVCPADIPAIDTPTVDKVHKWRTWAAREVQRRALLGHYVIDGQIATFSRDQTSVRHVANKLDFPVNEDAFNAKTAHEWIEAMLAKGAQQCPITPFSSLFLNLFPNDLSYELHISLYSPFSWKIVLEGLSSVAQEVLDAGDGLLGLPSLTSVRQSLVKALHIIQSSRNVSLVDKLEAGARWHGICLDLETNSATLCKVICRQLNIP